MMVLPSKKERSEDEKLRKWLRMDMSVDEIRFTIDPNAPDDVKELFRKKEEAGEINV